jgi:RimJ/RimL family protein N-acetyltransferase
VDTVAHPRLVEADVWTALGALSRQVVPQQLALVGPAIFDRHGHHQQITDVAQGCARVDDSPVEKACTAVVVEQVSDVGVPVNDCGWSLMPERVKGRTMRDVEFGVFRKTGREAIAMLIQTMAEQCFAHERFQADPRLSTKLANERYGRWVVSSFQSRNQLLLKIEDRDEIVAFFIVEYLNEKSAYWHLTAVAPEFQSRGYGRKTWQTMLAYHKACGIERVTTTITARNVRVLNLYSKLQFKFAPPEMTFHWIVE